MTSMLDPYQAGAAQLARMPAAAQHLHADITLAIGGTAAMNDLCCRLSADAADMAKAFSAALPAWAQTLPCSLRMRVIRFGDVYMDADPFDCSPFFSLPRHSSPLGAFLNRRFNGGGSPKKSALEALHLAMLSDWSLADGHRRHIIALLTDCPAYLPEEPQRRIDAMHPVCLASHSGSTEPMPLTMDALRRQWRDGAGQIDNWNSRLAVIAPHTAPWDRIAHWPRTQSFPAENISQLRSAELMPLLASLL